ncbi:MAG: hypothetical protein WA843_00150 [Candidatus Saccharimonadales bacterium]
MPQTIETYEGQHQDMLQWQPGAAHLLNAWLLEIHHPPSDVQMTDGIVVSQNIMVTVVVGS